jgi:hypothetical protein
LDICLASSGIGEHATLSLITNTSFDFDVFATVRSEVIDCSLFYFYYFIEGILFFKQDGRKLLDQLKNHPKAHKLHIVLMDVTIKESIVETFHNITIFLIKNNVSLVGIVNV